MKYQGHIWSYGYKDPDSRVREAILTETKLSLDFEEDGYKAHLDGKLTTGDLFEAKYSFIGLQGIGQSTFRLYRSGERVLLFGTWYWPPTEEDGTWVIVLDPLV